MTTLDATAHRRNRFLLLGAGGTTVVALTALAVAVSPTAAELGLWAAWLGVLVASVYFAARSRRVMPFDVRGVDGRPAFTAAAAPGVQTVLTVCGALLATAWVRVATVATAEPARSVAQIGAAIAVLVACVGILALRQRGTVTLTADGVTVRTWRRERAVRWEDLTPGRTYLWVRFRPRVVLPGRVVVPHDLTVSAPRLDRAIRFYVDNPARRAGIGTAEEYAVLMAHLTQTCPIDVSGNP